MGLTDSLQARCPCTQVPYQKADQPTNEKPDSRPPPSSALYPSLQGMREPEEATAGTMPTTTWEPQELSIPACMRCIVYVQLWQSIGLLVIVVPRAKGSV
ncbi:hypothetical protein AAFF_G00124920 [Aldrovandia affinis]|uniref:Uncharacterized protein n=1 Tax=Aldrovandia affinis TaxID=143900 RepID=A0AAD7W9I7_9TELE|nr:hypothetical protein AAFF_G00124920 [Aldrovandia affinis]